MHQEFTEQLSAYADGELAPAMRTTLERHLAGCAECRKVLEEIRAVSAWAPTYQGMPTSRDLWQDIERRLSTRPISTARGRQASWHGRRITVRAPLLAAAAILLMLLSAGAMWLLKPGSTGPRLAETPPSPAKSWDIKQASMTQNQYDAAINELEAMLASNDTALDSETLRVIRESLATIDTAIEEARAAIARDSTDDYLNASIALNMRRKLDILRTATHAATAKS